MTKFDEIRNSDSCLNRARDDEMTFVLLARDIAAPGTIRFWVQERLHFGKNSAGDPEIVEALRCANRMEQQRREFQNAA